MAQQCLYNWIDKLVEKGLPEGSARRVDHWLTEKGKKFVPLIMKMAKSLSDDS